MTGQVGEVFLSVLISPQWTKMRITIPGKGGAEGEGEGVGWVGERLEGRGDVGVGILEKEGGGD